MPRLALVCEYPTLNGGEHSLLAALPAVVQAGFDPVCIAPPDGPLAERLRHDGIAHEPFIWRDGASRRPLDKVRDDLAATLRKISPQLVHANSLSTGRVTGPVVATLKLPSLSHLRDILRLPVAQIDDLNCHTRLLAVSTATREAHVAQGLSAAKTHVLHNGVDLEVFQPRPSTGYLHRELGLDPSAYLIGTIGQLVLRKGQDVLLTAAHHLKSRWPNVHYVIVGSRYSEKAEAVAFEEYLRRTGDSQVHFLPHRDDISPLLTELTLLVHPARQEPLGRVLLEAAACGVPIVATDVGGTREIFPHDSGSARLVPPDDPRRLGDAIDALLASPLERTRLAQAARRRAAAAFDVTHSAASLVAHYRAVLGT